jgi:crotonobetainyl-CoA:carnitine CoA-transferase CaiB-like acyl-CoA transferase
MSEAGGIASSPIPDDAAGPLPLAGVRVLEFGYGVAAPVACRNLAQFGADAIKVESVRRPDSLRTVGAGWVPLETEWDVLRDTGAALNFTSPGKRSIGLEVDDPKGLEILHRLVAASDVLVMNMSVDGVAGLGLSYAEMRAVNPRLIWMNMPSFGAQEGPYQTFRTWGRNIAAMAGLTRLVGWPDRDPVGMSVNFPDYVSALWGTVAVVCALMQRDVTGEGCEIDVSQFQVAMSSIGPTVMEAVLGGTGLGSLGNRREGRAPHGVYPTRDADRWVAISVMDEDMWRGLCTIDGLEDLRRDPRYLTLAGRLAHQDDLDETVSRWTERITPWEAASELQAVGVAAAPVANNWEVLLDPQLEARDFFRVVPHARFGAELSYGQAIVLSDTGARFTRAAPAFGEDTRSILRDVAGLDDDEIAAAIDSGIAHPMTHPEVHLERPYLHWLANLMPKPWPASTVDPALILYDRLANERGGDRPAGLEAPPPEPGAPSGGPNR